MTQDTTTENKTSKLKPRIIDLHKERIIAGIVEVLRGMDTIYVECLFGEMLKRRDDVLALRKKKDAILDNIEWGYSEEY